MAVHFQFWMDSSLSTLACLIWCFKLTLLAPPENQKWTSRNLQLNLLWSSSVCSLQRHWLVSKRTKEKVKAAVHVTVKFPPKTRRKQLSSSTSAWQPGMVLKNPQCLSILVVTVKAAGTPWDKSTMTYTCTHACSYVHTHIHTQQLLSHTQTCNTEQLTESAQSFNKAVKPS